MPLPIRELDAELAAAQLEPRKPSILWDGRAALASEVDEAMHLNDGYSALESSAISPPRSASNPRTAETTA